MDKHLIAVLIYDFVIAISFLFAVALCAIKFDNSDILWFWLAAPLCMLRYKKDEDSSTKEERTTKE